MHYIEILRATDELNIKALLNDLNNGYLYNISVFVIDDGLPVNRTATIPTILSTSDVGTMEQSGESLGRKVYSDCECTDWHNINVTTMVLRGGSRIFRMEGL